VTSGVGDLAVLEVDCLASREQADSLRTLSVVWLWVMEVAAGHLARHEEEV
jgi:hypothetical protein